MTIRSITYHAQVVGPRLLVLGAIHGNEKCGTIAIERLMTEINAGQIEIKRGQVTFVPICNPRAYVEDKRFIERNLNRYLVPTPHPKYYEAQLGNILCPMLEACDVLLDIHSYTIGGDAFVFLGATGTPEDAFAASLGAGTLITGWQEAYAATGRKENVADENESTGTTEYARQHGAIAVLLECGQHKAPQSAEVAYRGITGALRHLKIIDGSKTEAVAAPRLVTMTHVFYRDDEGQLSKNWGHLEPISKGQMLAEYKDGKAIRAPEDGFIILPHANCPIGAEWFYFGTASATR